MRMLSDVRFSTLPLYMIHFSYKFWVVCVNDFIVVYIILTQ